MPCLKCDLHGLKANSSARADDQDCRHASCSRSARLAHVMCDTPSRAARWVVGLYARSRLPCWPNKGAGLHHGTKISLAAETESPGVDPPQTPETLLATAAAPRPWRAVGIRA